MKIAGSLEKASEHPLAEAVVEKVSEEKIELDNVSEFVAITGRGVKGKIDEHLYFGGNISFMKENNIDITEIENESQILLDEGKTVLYFADSHKCIGVIAVLDNIKSTSFSAVEELKNKNIDVVMITGDNEKVAKQIGKSVGIDKVIAEVLPADKERQVSDMQKQGKKVVFVGDGINDSPALVKADVGIGIGSGTDIAIEAADIILMKDKLLDVVTAIDLSKAVIKNIKINLFWAFFYNAVGIPIAAGVFYLEFGLKLNPMLGALAMSLSSVCVVTNALRLRSFKSKYNENKYFKEEKKMSEFVKKVSIEGMSCNHCKMTVEKVLGAINGVNSVEVSLENKQAIISSDKDIENTEIEKVIIEAGFEVKEIK